MSKFLTKEQELDCGKKIQAMLKVQEDKKNDSLTVSEKEYENIVSTGKDAMDLLVQSNMRLVYNQAQRFKAKFNSAPEIEDIIQDGMVGMMTAVLKYDPKRGNKFSTVATYWIYQAITRSSNYTARLVRLPEGRIAEYSKLVQSRNKFLDEGFSAGKAEVKARKEVGLTGENYYNIVNAGTPSYSLNMSAQSKDDDSNKEFGDVIGLKENLSSPSADTGLYKKHFYTEMCKLMENLTEDEREIIYGHFGFNSTNGNSIDKQLKKKLGGKKYHRQLKKGLEKLRLQAVKNGFTYEDFL